MSKRLKKAKEMMVAAYPASNGMPSSDYEWDQLLKAREELGYAKLADAGIPEKEARIFSKLIFGGETGKHLYYLFFDLRELDDTGIVINDQTILSQGRK